MTDVHAKGPNISVKRKLSIDEALTQIGSMIDERFPFMDMQKMLNYPVQSSEPQFSDSVNFATIGAQGNSTNCVVSNLFAMLETLDRISGADSKVTDLRYKTTREFLMKTYSFYESNFSPFTEGYSLDQVWSRFKTCPTAAV